MLSLEYFMYVISGSLCNNPVGGGEWCGTNIQRGGRHSNSLVSLLRCNHELPWWFSGGESSCQCRRHGFNPWSGRIPLAMGHQSPRATAVEPVL